MLGLLEVLFGCVAILLALYYYLAANLDFWKNRNVPGPKPVPLFGNIRDVMLTKTSMGDHLKTLYDRYKGEPFIGIFAQREPILVVCDLDFVKDVLIRNFTAFEDRGIIVHQDIERLSEHLFLLEPERWRPLRTCLSPVFTSGKIKQMFYLLLECAEVFEKNISEIAEKNESIDIRNLTANFTTDVIGSCAFGLKMNAVSGEESEFRKIGRKFFNMNRKTFFRMILREGCPSLYRFLVIYCNFNKEHEEITDFFINIMKQTVELREKNNIERHDFVDLLMELKNNPSKAANIEFTDSFMACQAFIFFLAGFETSSTTISNALYEMALNTRIQDKVRLEMKEQIKKDGGKLTYEGIKEMKYLDMVVQETLRKYPALAFLTRRATANYTFNGTNLTIMKGQRVWIPVYAIQRDPSIFPKPDIFDPERYTPEAVASRHAMTHLPFGDGPRNCIGMRFGLYQTKVGLVKTLLHHKVDVCEKTPIPYVNDPMAFVLAPMGGQLYLKISKAK